jgi:hypothetical protein
MPGASTIIKFRRNAALVTATLVAVVPGLWVGFGAPSVPIILLALGTPILIAVASWRRGTDAGVDGLVIWTLLVARRVPWSQVSELVPESKRRVSAQLTTGAAIELPAVRPADLAMLVTVADASRRPYVPLRGDLQPRVMHRIDWRLVPLLVSIYMVFVLTVWSVRVLRFVPVTMPSDVPVVKMLPAGGWPFAYLYDNPCCSVVGSLGMEDTFKPGWFLLDAAVFSVLPLVVGALVYGLPRLRPSRGPAHPVRIAQ